MRAALQAKRDAPAHRPIGGADLDPGGAGMEVLPGDLGEVAGGGGDVGLEASSFGDAVAVPHLLRRFDVDLESRESLQGCPAFTATSVGIVGDRPPAVAPLVV